MSQAYLPQKKFDLGVYIGRFSPFHIGHEAMLKKAFHECERILVLVGSVNKPRTIKDPWTFEERRTMILDWFKRAQRDVLVHDKQLTIAPLKDIPYSDDLWAAAVQEEVNKKLPDEIWSGKKPAVALIGTNKDNTTYYLDMFPQWERISIPAVDDPRWENPGVLSSTKIRDVYFTNPKSGIDICGKIAPGPTMEFLREFIKTPAYAQLAREYEFIRKYKEDWAVAPYPPTFVTTDAIVIQSGHILLIKRKSEPGAGLWALPGGFVGQEETLFNGCIRELHEETGIKVPEKILRKSLYKKDVFDRPDRSTRGRTITHAFYFRLDSSLPLPHIRGADDAEKAKWFPIADFQNMESVMYEDHYSIAMAGI